MRWTVPIACGVLLVLMGCSSNTCTEPCPIAGTTCDPEDGVCKCAGKVCGKDDFCDLASQRCVAPVCTAGTVWVPGTQAFREATDRWGLSALGVAGIRLSVADVDGDGYPDLSVRRGGAGADDFSPPGTRVFWLLRNAGGQRFEDRTQESGLVAPRGNSGGNKGRPAEVVVWADVDNDGDLDAFTGTSRTSAGPQAETSEIMLNRGDGTFDFGPKQSAVRREGLFALASAAFTDFDRDGLVDLWVGFAAASGSPDPDELYRGLGDGRFESATREARLETEPWTSLAALNEARAHTYSWGVAACDLNADGTPELLSASYGRAPNHLWRGRRTGAGRVLYDNVSIPSGYAFDHRVDWSDNESARCYCKLHRDAPDCASVPEPRAIACQSDSDVFRWNHAQDREPFRLGGNSGTTVCADLNNDGALDLVTTEIVHWDVGSSSDPSEILFNENDPEVRFRRPGNEVTGLLKTRPGATWDDGDMTAAVFDFDNDGWPDVLINSSDYPGTRAWLYHQAGIEKFEAVPLAEGIDHMSSHGVAVADFDRDGDLDVVLGHSHARCGSGSHCYPTQTPRFFENVLGQDGNWIQLRLEGGPGTNRSAIGARVQVTAGGVTQTQEVGGGHGHYGIQHDLTLHFGLGAACTAEVRIRWPDAALSQEVFRLPAGHRYHIRQGQHPAVVP